MPFTQIAICTECHLPQVHFLQVPFSQIAIFSKLHLFKVPFTQSAICSMRPLLKVPFSQSAICSNSILKNANINFKPSLILPIYFSLAQHPKTTVGSLATLAWLLSLLGQLAYSAPFYIGLPSRKGSFTYLFFTRLPSTQGFLH